MGQLVEVRQCIMSLHKFIGTAALDLVGNASKLSKNKFSETLDSNILFCFYLFGFEVVLQKKSHFISLVRPLKFQDNSGNCPY